MQCKAELVDEGVPQFSDDWITKLLVQLMEGEKNVRLDNECTEYFVQHRKGQQNEVRTVGMFMLWKTVRQVLNVDG